MVLLNKNHLPLMLIGIIIGTIAGAIMSYIIRGDVGMTAWLISWVTIIFICGTLFMLSWKAPDRRAYLNIPVGLAFMLIFLVILVGLSSVVGYISARTFFGLAPIALTTASIYLALVALLWQTTSSRVVSFLNNVAGKVTLSLGLLLIYVLVGFLAEWTVSN